MDEGTLAGYPLVNVKFTLMDGAFHAVDSSSMAFEAATRNAYRQSIPKAKPQMLEPIMKVDVFTPEDHVGDVIGDLNRRRGMIKAQEAGPTGVRVKAEAPLSEMFGYIGDLRTMTSGRGQFSMEFDHYAPCPTNVAQKWLRKQRHVKKPSSGFLTAWQRTSFAGLCIAASWFALSQECSKIQRPNRLPGSAFFMIQS